ncbi:site-specific integrase [Lusitaniella coriacea LEGE 07157]|uniref:Site-specific integrase n=1 Tax=Lusitaniella coriacea LEGE 07157 TaxID=945747 RepID=A0A8J7B7I2_9CYAN|nr:site-specific integrase [Lusitaniella coriacea]MBE9115276.1 site-specific integrase [Lusitaniella coriacea LEGE 07157]
MVDNYDEQVEKIEHYNQPILDGFKDWLEKSNLSAKTVRNHVNNIESFAEYLVCYEPLRRLDEIEDNDVSDFLIDWFPRKALWASESTVKSYIASFRKFAKYMIESQRMSAEQETEIRETLKEGKEEFLDAVRMEDSAW